MENDSENTKKVDIQDFSIEYNEIISTTKQSVVIETQWAKDGDFFKKLSMYDDSYVSFETLGSTTLIKAL
tara:strand:- start:4226 stop:4435 length:210 start_codon:yes stop_codon:yes gene_type:complete